MIRTSVLVFFLILYLGVEAVFVSWFWDVQKKVGGALFVEPFRNPLRLHFFLSVFVLAVCIYFWEPATLNPTTRVTLVEATLTFFWLLLCASWIISGLEAGESMVKMMD